MRETTNPIEVDGETMSVSTAEHFDTGRGATAVWAGFILPPIGFLTAMEGAYLLVPWACRKGSPGVVWLGLLPGIAILVIGALAAFRVRREMGGGLGHEFTGAGGWVSIDPTPSRVRFMAAVGVLSSLLFLLLILALAVPIAVLHPCD